MWITENLHMHASYLMMKPVPFCTEINFILSRMVRGMFKTTLFLTSI